ncbi:MAG: hypothetical protein HZC44_07440 [Geobacter sp.]|nr:hypothetical protein [Geobacter sp.]
MKRQAVIGMVAAMPEEIRPLLGQMQQIRKETVEGYRLYRFETGGQHVCLVESGMGPTHAATATRILIDAVQPSLIVNFGFAGALAPDLQVGDIVLANRLLLLHERLFSEQQGLSQAVTERIEAFLARCKETVSHRTTFVTAGKIVTKKELALRLPAGAALSVIEMETSAVARIANRNGTPLGCCGWHAIPGAQAGSWRTSCKGFWLRISWHEAVGSLTRARQLECDERGR